jgi:hypothetical protein
VVKAQKTAVLVIRAWLEEGLDTNALRARITRTVDVSDAGTLWTGAAPVSGAERLETAAASEEEILAAVLAWLRSFTGSSVTAG